MYKLIVYSDELYHHGVKGMKWGVRRYQNYDGTRIPMSYKEFRSEFKRDNRLKAERKERRNKYGKNTDAAYESFKETNPKIKELSDKLAKEYKAGIDAENDTELWEKDYDQWLANVEKHTKESVRLQKELDREMRYFRQEERKFTSKAIRDTSSELGAKEVFDSLSDEDKRNLTSTGQYKTSEKLIDRSVKYVDGKPVAFAEIERDPTYKDVAYMSVATRSGYGGKGYGTDQAKKMLESAKKNGVKEVYWETTKSNDASNALAKKLGFTPANNFSSEESNWVYYLSDELKHHGVKGMKWGVRRYQNYDGTRIGVSESEHYNRNKHNKNVPKTLSDAKRRGWVSGVSNNAHQRNTTPGKRNVKMVSPDGHREGVYNSEGELVGGSYNYSSPLTNKPGHFVNDVAPYIVYGSNENDQTTALKRTEELLGIYSDHPVKDAFNAIRGREQSLKNTARGYMTGHYLRNRLNKNLPQNDAEAEKRGWRKLSDKDSSMHQFHQEDGVKNSKWVSPSGHREVVFTGKGENQHITTDPRDMGTYNIFDPKKHPFGHATFDVMPYVLLGNNMNDNTTMYDRIVDSTKNYIANKRLADIDEKSVDLAKKRLG